MPAVAARTIEVVLVIKQRILVFVGAGALARAVKNGAQTTTAATSANLTARLSRNLGHYFLIILLNLNIFASCRKSFTQRFLH